MQNYKNLLSKVLNEGTKHTDRTGVGTIRTFGEMLTFDLREGFPVLSLRKAPWKSAIGEMVGFVNAFNTIEQFHSVGCKFWDKNAEDWGDDGELGSIYGVQARMWLDYGNDSCNLYDQLANVLTELKNNPDSRRLLVTHWRPDEFAEMALPPCHVQYQFLADKETKLLSLKFDMRSTDLVLGAPNNIVGYAWLLTVVAEAYGYTAHKLIMTMADCHIYQDHIDGVKEMLTREVLPMPTLIKPMYEGGDELMWIESLRPHEFILDNYQHHEPIKFNMAV